MDQLQAIKVFAKVVETGSFAGAAEALGLSRTMASKHVMDLEGHLNARLLNRTTRKVSLTSTGSAYFERCRQILFNLEEADHEASLHSLTPRGRLRISAPMSFGVAHVAPLIAPYMERFPDVETDLVLNDRHVDLIEEGYDLAIRIGKLSDSSLIAKRLSPCRLITCAAPRYLERYGTPGHPSELADHTCLGYSLWLMGNTWRFEGPDGAVSVRFRDRMSCNNGNAVMAAAIGGLGIILQPDFIVYKAIADGRLVEILPDYSVSSPGIHAVYPHSRQLSARVRTFIDFLSDAYGRDPYWRVPLTK